MRFNSFSNIKSIFFGDKGSSRVIFQSSNGAKINGILLKSHAKKMAILKRCDKEFNHKT